MKKSIFYTFGLALAAIAFASCDDFLDKMPDSRAELDTEEKVVKMLVSAYPDNTYNMCAEFSSDNVDDYGSIKSYNQLQEELYNWQEVSSVSYTHLDVYKRQASLTFCSRYTFGVHPKRSTNPRKKVLRFEKPDL